MGEAAEDGNPSTEKPRGEVEREIKDEEVVVKVDSASMAAEGRVSRLQIAQPVGSLQVAPQARSVVQSSGDFRPAPVMMDPTVTSLNSRRYTNRISLFLFLLHQVAAAAAMSFFIYKAAAGILASTRSVNRRGEHKALTFWLPPTEGAALLSILLAFFWQKLVRSKPTLLTIRFIIWFSFLSTLSCGAFLLCLGMAGTDAIGLALVLFSVGVGLYACWASRRMGFAAKVLNRSLNPAEAKFPTLNRPAYGMMAAGAVWITLWCFAVIGAVYGFDLRGLTVVALVLSLMWTAEVMRNVANLTVSRAVALYYLRGMQSDVGYCFQRAVTINLGSACLGSLFVPAIEFCRIIARALNLLEGEDEFLFSCAHCCLRVMEAVFSYGNSWAYVHIAAYGRGFVQASQSTWGMFQRCEMEALVDADITSAICFLSGISSGALCAIFAASWTYSEYKNYTATASLLAFFVGYLMTRIGMALPQACVGCYYVCYAENPTSRFFLNDSTIADRLEQIRSGR